jgi:hypothetical protein
MINSYLLFFSFLGIYYFRSLGGFRLILNKLYFKGQISVDVLSQKISFPYS